ncbi:hypothetical protein J6600_01980 [Bacillus sp. LJBV19]|uniref:hypothetical protein n=1 Tax=Bacillus sp. LJBV19 TaxID=2821409 RepID=UPI001AE0D99B|nr:hypothetical protein [Bacillus sp. LJBV19]QTN96103.1 hypothetical protein J6600_01980 [Bacillus sp. LJBV19]
MSTLQLQTFLTCYIRNNSLRERMKSQSTENILYEYDLSKEELKLIETLDFTQLNRTADHLEEERKGKRCADFSEFTSVLQQANLFDSFFSSFTQSYTDGFLTSEIEAERFLEHAHKYISDNSLPDILADLATYSYQVFRISQVEIQDVYNKNKLNWNKPLFLKRPFSKKTFSYNLMEIINNENIKKIEDIETIQKKETTYLFQKDYSNLISSNIFEVDDSVFFRLVEQNLTGYEILNRANSINEKGKWRDLISELYDLDIVGTTD